MNPNSIVAGALLRSLPLVALVITAAFAYLAHTYIKDTDQAAGEILKLRTNAVARAIDSEFVHAIENIKEHLATWDPGPAPLESASGRQKLVSFLQNLHEKDSRFVLSAAAYERELVKVGEDRNTPDRVVLNLDFFELPDHGLASTGLYQANARSTDVWFELRLSNGGDAPIVVRSLRRLHDYYSWIRPLLNDYPESLFVLRPRQDRGSRILISGQSDSTITRLVPEVVSLGNNEPIEIGGDTYLTWSTRLRQYPAEVIYAAKSIDLKGSRVDKFALVFGVTGGAVLLSGFLLLGFLRKQVRFIKRIDSTISTLSQARSAQVVEHCDVAELSSLGASVSSLITSIADGQISSKIVEKSTLEMFSCTDAKSAILKAVELSCTQVGAVVAWFEPFVADQTYYKGAQTGEAPTDGWIWRNHRISPLSKAEALDIQASYPERHVLEFMTKCGHDTVGTLKAYFEDLPRDVKTKVFDALGGILEKTLNRQEAIRKEVLLVTERNFARSVQKSVIAQQEAEELEHRVARFYRPSERLSREWFHVLHDPQGDGCFLVLGGVESNGLSQGIISSGIKGGFEVLEHVLRENNRAIFKTPLELMQMFDRIVTSMGSEKALDVSCLVVHVNFKTGFVQAVNKGHTMPFIVSPGDDGQRVSLLSEISKRSSDDAVEAFEATLSAGQYLVAFSDGLAQAKGLKSEIFERFMINALRRSGAFNSPAALRDELQQMYEFYTSGKRQDQDVCFLVICTDEAGATTKSA